MKFQHQFTRADFLIIGALLILILIPVAMLYPVAGSPPSVARTRAKNDAVQIAMAIKGFIIEHGRYPTTSRGDITTDVSDELLAALTMSNSVNPKGIVFIETTPWKKGEGGIQDGIWKDPWGNPFRVSMDVDDDSTVTVSTNGATTGTSMVKKWVGVWSVTTNTKQQVRSWD